MTHRRYDCRCRQCIEHNQYFANALRNWLGLSPLYRDRRSKQPNYRVHYHRRKPSGYQRT